MTIYLNVCFYFCCFYSNFLLFLFEVSPQGFLYSYQCYRFPNFVSVRDSVLVCVGISKNNLFLLRFAAKNCTNFDLFSYVMPQFIT